MVTLFRIFVVTAIVLLLVAVVLPLGRPIHFAVSLDQAFPLWLVASGAILLTALVALVASGGLFFFKRWGRWLGLFVAVAGAVIAFFVAGDTTSTPLSPAAVTLLVLSVSLWVAGLFASCHPVVSAKFRHVR